MPTVDFTLEDVKNLLAGEREHTKGLFAAEREHTRGTIDDALIKEREHTQGLLVAEREHTKGLFAAEREHTQGLFEAEREHTKEMIAHELLNLWDTNIGPAFEELHTEFAELRREVKGMRLVVDRHSKDIMELRA